jgi:ribosomal protein S18 acetylase RimI-like enzyme
MGELVCENTDEAHGLPSGLFVYADLSTSIDALRNRYPGELLFFGAIRMTELPRSEPGLEPVIRRALPSDLQQIGRLGALLVETHHGFDARRFLAPTRGTKDAYASFLSTQLDAPDAAIFVAAERAHVIGYAYIAIESYDYMSLRGPAGVLHDIIVDPERRGRGVGRRLLEAALAYLESRALAQIVLSTAEHNDVAQRLFASMGFRRTMIEMTRDS